MVVEESAEGGAKVSQVTRLVKGFEETDASADVKAFGGGELPRFVIIERYGFGAEFFC